MKAKKDYSDSLFDLFSILKNENKGEEVFLLSEFQKAKNVEISIELIKDIDRKLSEVLIDNTKYRTAKFLLVSAFQIIHEEMPNFLIIKHYKSNVFFNVGYIIEYNKTVSLASHIDRVNKVILTQNSESYFEEFSRSMPLGSGGELSDFFYLSLELKKPMEYSFKNLDESWAIFTLKYEL